MGIQPIRKTVVPEIPDKLYFRIGDVARLCEVPAYVLRFWETEFPQLKPNKGGTGQRLYRRKDVEMALRIKTLLYDQGYTIPGARQAFKAEALAASAASAPVVQAAAEPAGPAQEPAPGPAPQSIGQTTPEMAADQGAEIRRRAQLRDLREELATVVQMLSKPLSTPLTGAAALTDASSGAETEANVHGGGKAALRPRLVVEPRPKPAAKLVAQPTLHLAQGDLFGIE
jgi:DNA-binding transcriptional MerR regulator